MSRPTPFVSALLLVSAALTTTAASAQDYGSRGNLGETATTSERAEIEALYERFVPYIDRARTELAMVRETVAYAEARGFIEWDPQVRNPSPGGPLLRCEPRPHDGPLDSRPGAARLGDAADQQPHRLGAP